MIDNHMPMFVNEASCYDKEYDPELWHPEEVGGRGNRWAHTPEAELARSICHSCPARVECKEYALKYSGLTGIWAGMDRVERTEMQRRLKIRTILWTDSFESAVHRSSL